MLVVVVATTGGAFKAHDGAENQWGRTWLAHHLTVAELKTP